MQKPYYAKIPKTPITSLYNSYYFIRLYANWIYEKFACVQKICEKKWFWFSFMQISFNYSPLVIGLSEWSEFHTIEYFSTWDAEQPGPQ